MDGSNVVNASQPGTVKSSRSERSIFFGSVAGQRRTALGSNCVYSNVKASASEVVLSQYQLDLVKLRFMDF